MRVLMLAPQPFLEPRGTPISVYQRARGLGALGHEVDLVTYHVGQDVRIPGVSIHRIPRVPFLRQVKVGPSWYKPLLDLLVLGKAIVLLATRRYDVIHSHEEAAFFAMALARLFRTRHVYDMHSSLPKQLANFNFGNYRPVVGVFTALEKRVIASCDALITIGSDLEQYAKGLNAGPKQVMIENMAVQDPDRPLDERAVAAVQDRWQLRGRLAVVYAGTFERYQGIGLLLETAKLVKERLPEVAFVLVGGKPDQVVHWQREAIRLGVVDCVHFAGTVPLGESRAYLEAADILVSPRTEGTSVPLKVYTYLESGKPIVATNLPAHTLVLGEDTAVLVEPSKEAFAEGILRLAGDPALRQRLGEQGRRVAAEKYGLEAYLARLRRAYGLLEAPHEPRAA